MARFEQVHTQRYLNDNVRPAVSEPHQHQIQTRREKSYPGNHTGRQRRGKERTTMIDVSYTVITNILNITSSFHNIFI